MAKYTVTLNFSEDIKVKVDSSTNIPDFKADDEVGNSLSMLYNATGTETEENKSNADTSFRLKKYEEDGTTNMLKPVYNLGATFSISSIYLKKEVYHPGHAIIVLHFTNVDAKTDEKPLPDSFSKNLSFFLKQSLVTLKKEEDEIAVNYCIYNFTIKHTSQKVSYDVTIHAYSPDYALTLQKFSKVYTGKKLYEDILLPNPGEGESLSSSFWPKTLLHKIDFYNKGEAQTPFYMRVNLNRLRYRTPTLKMPEFEYIHPYLVQYNESPYDFMVRTLNRCGEYFYYEKGAFIFGWIEPSLITKEDRHLEILGKDKNGNIIYAKEEELDGSKKSKADEDKVKREAAGAEKNRYGKARYITEITQATATDISTYASAEEMLSLEDESEVEEVYYNYAVSEEDGEDDEDYQKTIEKYQTEISKDKKYKDSPVASDENLARMPGEKGYVSGEDFPTSDLFWSFMNCLSQYDLESMLSELLWSESIALFAEGWFILENQEKYKEEIFDAGIYLNDRINSEDSRMLFSTGKALLDQSTENLMIFDYPFYQKNAQGIEKAEKGRIEVDIDNENYSLYLGSLVSLNGKEYVVVYIEDNGKTCTIQALPYTKISSTEKTNASYELYPPMVNHNLFFQKSSGSQRAFITANQDPLKMNRVRVRYAWQSKDDDESPWIRMTQPMASAESGFNFLPEVGDEALIAYENNNIEKPYVAGMVYNAEKKLDTIETTKRSITSVNGHSITFSDPDDGKDALKGFFPGWDFLTTFLPFQLADIPEINEKDNNNLRKGAGGIELTDSLGFYSISMSTDRRNITIESPIGNVEMNAFTGITISAPLGDVTIEGKNVEIRAGNNLSLISGDFMEPYVSTETTAERAKEVGISLFEEFQPVDMTLVRTFFESFLRPVGGRLLIKSRSNLCFEAGVDAETEQIGYDTDYIIFDNIYRDLLKFEKAYSLIVDSHPTGQEAQSILNEASHKCFPIFPQLTADQKTNFRDERTKLKDGTKIDASKYPASTRDAINELNNYDIQGISSKFQSFATFVAACTQDPNIDNDSKAFINSHMTDFKECFDEIEFSERTKRRYGFTTHKLFQLKTSVDVKKVLLYKYLQERYTANGGVPVTAVPTPNPAATNAHQNQNPNPAPAVPTGAGTLTSTAMDLVACPSLAIPGQDLQSFFEEHIQPVEMPDTSPRRGQKFGKFLKENWGWDDVDTEFTHLRKTTGSILYTSGGDSTTYSINKNRLEICNIKSDKAIARIRELIKNA